MPHILLIEDNPGDATLIREMYRDADVIGQEYTITHVTRVGDAIELLSKSHDIDLILSDMSLPDSQGLETLDSLADIASSLPVIFMTGINNEAFVSQAIKAGAQDYLVKGNIDSQVLTRTTAYSIERKKAQREYQHAVKKAQELEQQKSQLVSLNLAKDEFISLASHQLRTPATAVKQYLSMVLAGYVGTISDEMEPYLNIAYTSNERQLNIINDLLKTAQLDSGQYELNKENYAISKLISETVDEFKPIIAMRKQKIVFDNDTTATACIDPSELRVALSNLIENASKYSPDNGTIRIMASTSKNTAYISVHDEGVGIAAEDQSKVFQKFTRVDNELSDTVNGSGLGLYFVRKIATLHNGTVSVLSSPGKGSTFTLELPS